MTKHFFGDTAALQGRSLRHILRSPDTIITTTIIADRLHAAVRLRVRRRDRHRVGVRTSATCCPASCSSPSHRASPTPPSGSSGDLESGIFERFQSIPIARSSELWAHVGTSLVANRDLGRRRRARRPTHGLPLRRPGLLAWLAVAGTLGPVHPGADLARRHPRSHREVRGRRESPSPTR